MAKLPCQVRKAARYPTSCGLAELSSFGLDLAHGAHEQAQMHTAKVTAIQIFLGLCTCATARSGRFSVHLACPRCDLYQHGWGDMQETLLAVLISFCLELV